MNYTNLKNIYDQFLTLNTQFVPDSGFLSVSSSTLPAGCRPSVYEHIHIFKITSYTFLDNGLNGDPPF